MPLGRFCAEVVTPMVSFSPLSTLKPCVLPLTCYLRVHPSLTEAGGLTVQPGQDKVWILLARRDRRQNTTTLCNLDHWLGTHQAQHPKLQEYEYTEDINLVHLSQP